ncbi:MAG: MMPL family transporter [Actinobacteria bacterium]|nr:MMPL family transporter [Actinomycetota bacterium]MSX89983.1 MMPL family transporter [Actinomycetota bacterium]MSZ63892.1 MMPL family transporter [Actinomycetota bacterium]MTA57588.1 MMPL family transporter [Actinomycetota bacterium]
MSMRWVRIVIRNRLAITGIWILVVVAGAFASAHIGGRLTTSLEVPGSESATADAILASHFGENTQGSFTVLYKYATSTPAQIQEFKSAIEKAAQVIPDSDVAQQRAMGGVLLASITTPLRLLDAASYTQALRKAVAAQGLTGALITGPPAINHDVSPILASDLHRGQVVAIVMALLLLILMLGLSFAVVIPLIFAAASISLALGMVYLLSHMMLMVLYIPNIVELFGLGLAIDYSLLILHRFRRQLREKQDVDEAIEATMATAGHTVMVSALIVSVALATLLLVPVPFVRSLGAAGLIVPLASMFAAVTLAPVLLSILGHRALSTIGFKGIIGRSDALQGAWARIARLVIARPKSVFIASLATLAIMAAPIFWLALTPSSLTAIPTNLESAQGISMVVNRVGPGVITPHEVLIDLGANHLATTPQVDTARKKLAKQLLKNPEIFIVATEDKVPFIDPNGRYLRFFVIGRHTLGMPESERLVSNLRTLDLTQSGFSETAVLYLGGAPAQGVDLIRSILNSTPWIILLALLLTYILLTRAFRSLILPIKAIALDLISTAVALASLVSVFRFGFGSSFLHTYRLDQIEAWAIIFLLALLFGLSMDYELFLVSRMREARDRGLSNSDAIIEGLAHTGGVVSAAAIIFICAISGFVTGHFAGLQQLGIGLGIGVLIDATIIRGLLLPSTMVLMGRWNWWLPAPIAHLLKTKASPLD